MTGLIELAVDCPTCGRKAGERCYGVASKQIRRFPHKRRQEAYQVHDARDRLGTALAKGCGASTCRFAADRGGMRTNGGCKCDECPACGALIRHRRTHRTWCTAQDWVSPFMEALEHAGR